MWQCAITIGPFLGKLNWVILHFTVCKTAFFVLCCMGCLKKGLELRVQPLLQEQLHHWISMEACRQGSSNYVLNIYNSLSQFYLLGQPVFFFNILNIFGKQDKTALQSRSSSDGSAPSSESCQSAGTLGRQGHCGSPPLGQMARINN